MKVDSSTTVGSLCRALPSASAVLRRFGISSDLDSETTLSDTSREHGVPLENLILEIEQLDWNEQKPSN